MNPTVTSPLTEETVNEMLTEVVEPLFTMIRENPSVFYSECIRSEKDAHGLLIRMVGLSYVTLNHIKNHKCYDEPNE